MLKIAHITSSLQKGGAEEVLCSLVERLDPGHFASHVLYFHEGPHVARLRAAGIPTYHIRGLVCMYDPFFWWRLIRTLITIKPDCIHALLWAAQVSCRPLGWILGIPVISAYHNQVTLEHGIRALLDRYTLRYATSIIAVSTTVVNSLTSSYQWLPASRITVIPNGVAPELLMQAANKQNITKRMLGVAPQASIIGTVGRLHPIKNHMLLLEAYALVRTQHPSVYLVFVGDGSEQEKLHAAAKKMGVDAQVVFINNQQAYGYYHLFDCFVLPSAQEGMSMALLEAQYFKCSCVVAHENQAPHDVIIHGYNGLLVPPHDAAGLAQAIITTLTNITPRNRLGEQAHRDLLERFDIVQMVKKYEIVFINTMKKYNEKYMLY